MLGDGSKVAGTARESRLIDITKYQPSRRHAQYRLPGLMQMTQASGAAPQLPLRRHAQCELWPGCWVGSTGTALLALNSCTTPASLGDQHLPPSAPQAPYVTAPSCPRTAGERSDLRGTWREPRRLPTCPPSILFHRSITHTDGVETTREKAKHVPPLKMQL